MIDENKLIKEVQARQEFWVNNAIKSLSEGNIFAEETCNTMVRESSLILDMIKNQPKVAGWISCSERLPISGIDVEVTTEDGERKIGHYIGGLWYESIYTTCISVIAWKEPSEPWEEGEDEQMS